MAWLSKRGSVYYIKYWHNGATRRRTTGSSSFQIAKEKLRQFEAARANGDESTLPTRTPIADVLTAYVAHIRTVKTDKSAQTEIYYLRDAFGPVCEAVRITSRKVSLKVKKRPAKPGQDKRRKAAVIEAECFEHITTAQVAGFISGAMESRGLSPTTAIFAEMGQVIAVDLPNFGQSETRPDLAGPEPLGEFVIRIMKEFGLNQPHVVAPDVGTPACLFAAANHPCAFRSMVIGSGATDHTDIGGILDEIVNSPSLDPFKSLTGEQFVRGAIANMTKYKLPDSALQDYIASYAGERFWDAVAFIRSYPQSLPRLAKRLPEIQTPCQITVGRSDPFVPVSNAEGLHRGLLKSKLNVLECGHFVWEDAAAEYGRLAREFIAGGYAAL